MELTSSVKESNSNILLVRISGFNSIYGFPKVSGPWFLSPQRGIADLFGDLS